MKQDVIYITGHQHPDTDSIAAAIGYAFFKRANGIKAVPCRLGKIGTETKYLLDRFGFEVPMLLEDARVKMSEIEIDDPVTIHPEKTIYDAIQLMHETGRKTCGVVDDQDRVVGMLPLNDIGLVAMGDTAETEKLLEDAGYPGMKVLQYAFDWTEYSYYLPYNHIKNCVVYTGTHDNTTTRAWIEEISDHDRDLARRYIHSENTDYGTFVWDMIREAYRSVADLCIIPMQDYLVKGKEARINHPGTLGENWKWRLQPNFLSAELSESIYKLAKLYGRIPRAEKEDKTGK